MLLNEKEVSMRVSDLYNDIYTNNIAVNNENSNASFFKEGDIVEGIVTACDKDGATILFENKKTDVAYFDASQKREFRFGKDAVRDAHVGETRRFEVISANAKKLVLKDVTKEGVAGEVQKMSFTQIDPSLPQLIDNFSEIVGEDDNENSAKNLSEKDYSELSDERMSLEKFSSERLEHAIERIKEAREFKAESLETAAEDIRENREEIHKIAIGTAAKTPLERRIAELLGRADLPVTAENIAAVAASVNMAGAAASLNNNSIAYMVKGGLEPTPANIYKAVYSGVSKYSPLAEADWKQLESSVARVVEEANKELASKDMQTGMTAVSLGDARMLMEYDVPVTKENLLKMAALKDLKAADTAVEAAAAEASVEAVKNGEKAENGVIAAGKQPEGSAVGIRGTVLSVMRTVSSITDNAVRFAFRSGRAEFMNGGEPSIDGLGRAQQAIEAEPRAAQAMLMGMTEKELSTKLQLEEIRLKMTVDAGRKLMMSGINISTDGLEKVVAGLRELQKEFFGKLYQETGAAFRGSDSVMGSEEIAELAEAGRDAAVSLSKAPAALIGQTYSERHTISFGELAESGSGLRARLLTAGISYESVNGELVGVHGEISYSEAFSAYESGATQIRRDLGDSIAKAFRNADSLLEQNGLEASEANRRAVRILGYNSMEITVENIENIKYYDNKVSSLTERMTPAVVMEMVRRGVNPLNKTIDELSAELDSIIAEKGASPEEKYSSFLVKLEESGNITASEREGFIGIYRMLYSLEKSDGAAVGAAIKSGRELTLGNLMTERRSRIGSVDESVNDSTELKTSHYTNSITDQILNGVNSAGRGSELSQYAGSLARQITENAEPSAWKQALEGENPETLSLEHFAEKLNNLADSAEINNEAEAAALRNIMSANAGTKSFLKAFGVEDSFKNIRAAGREFGVEIEGSEETISEAASDDALTVSKNELMSALENESTTDELLGIRTRIANALTGQAFETRISAMTSVGLTEQLDRLGLIKGLADNGHYRFLVDEGGTAAGINLTVINNTGNAGTLSIQLKSADYNLTADLSLVIMRNEYQGGSAEDETDLPLAVSGSIVCDNAGAIGEIRGRLEEFRASLQGMGFGIGDISVSRGSESEKAYMARLASEKLAGDERPRVTTNSLYRAARSFVAAFL